MVQLAKKLTRKLKPTKTEVDAFLWCVSVYYSFENCSWSL